MEPVHTHTSIRNKKNFLATWPGLTEQFVQKFLQKSKATAKGHIWQSYKGKQSTHSKKQYKRRTKIQLARTVFFLQTTDFQEKITPIKPADSPSHPAADSDTSWSPTTTTSTKSMPKP